MEAVNLGVADGLPVVEWPTALEKLESKTAPAADDHNSRTTWLTTINEDGTPHVTPVGAVWVDGAYFFQTAAATKKGRKIARDPRCTVAVSAQGGDIVVEGSAVQVTDHATVARAVKAWQDQGWPCEPDRSGERITAPFNAPGLGPAPWNVYRVEARSAIVTLGAAPGGLTRFRF